MHVCILASVLPFLSLFLFALAAPHTSQLRNGVLKLRVILVGLNVYENFVGIC